LILTEDFIREIDNYKTRSAITQTKIAVVFADMDPSALSRAVNQKELFGPEIEKIKKLAKIINFTGQCFVDYQ